MRDIPKISPHRMDRVPIVVMSCTTKEVELAFGISLLAGFAFGIILGLFLGLAIGATIGGVIFLAGSFGTLKLLGFIKRGKPEGHYMQQVQIYKQNMGFGRAPFIFRSDSYDGFRTAQTGD